MTIRRSDQQQDATPGRGDIVTVTAAANEHYRDPFQFQVIGQHEWPTEPGWVWLDGYQLDTAGNPVTRRAVFVHVAGLHHDPSGQGEPAIPPDDNGVIRWRPEPHADGGQPARRHVADAATPPPHSTERHEGLSP